MAVSLYIYIILTSLALPIQTPSHVSLHSLKIYYDLLLYILIRSRRFEKCPGGLKRTFLMVWELQLALWTTFPFWSETQCQNFGRHLMRQGSKLLANHYVGGRFGDSVIVVVACQKRKRWRQILRLPERPFPADGRMARVVFRPDHKLCAREEVCFGAYFENRTQSIWPLPSWRQDRRARGWTSLMMAVMMISSGNHRLSGGKRELHGTLFETLPTSPPKGQSRQVFEYSWPCMSIALID